MSGPRIITECQACGSRDLESVLWLGYQPPCNAYREIGDVAVVEERYPIELFRCPKCELVQLSCVVPKETLFPVSYPYTSSTTRALRENFTDLAMEALEVCGLKIGPGTGAIVDIGGNDGNLLSHFDKRFMTVNITPERVGLDNADRVSMVVPDYFGSVAVDAVKLKYGGACLITATNVFAHVDDPHEMIEQMIRLLLPDGVICLENHYLPSLIEGLQYDAVYHEHLRYYSLRSLSNLLKMHGLEVFRCSKIGTHGGSLRTWVRRIGREPVDASVSQTMVEEWIGLGLFRSRLRVHRDEMREFFRTVGSGDVVGFGAPSRATVMINYLGLDKTEVAAVYEVSGSHRIGKWIPGTRIPVELEPEGMTGAQYGILFSHHLADELAPILKKKVGSGSIHCPLPDMRIL